MISGSLAMAMFSDTCGLETMNHSNFMLSATALVEDHHHLDYEIVILQSLVH